MTGRLVSHSALDVLIVDDNIQAAFVLGEVLKGAGHRVRIATGGNEAITAATSQPPDAILMDINMPDLDGVDAAKRIKTLMPTVRIIGMSGIRVPDEVGGDLLIFDGRLLKPIAPDALIAALEHR